MTYTIVLERGEDDAWSGYAPDLPGLLLLGDTREGLIRDAAAAISDYLEVMRERGLAPGKVGEHIANIAVEV